MGRIILAFITKFKTNHLKSQFHTKPTNNQFLFPTRLLHSHPEVFSNTQIGKSWLSHSAKNGPIQEPSRRIQPNLPHRRRPPSAWHSPTCRSPRGRTARWACTASGGRSTPGPRGGQGPSCQLLPYLVHDDVPNTRNTFWFCLLFFSIRNIFLCILLAPPKNQVLGEEAIIPAMMPSPRIQY